MRRAWRSEQAKRECSGSFRRIWRRDTWCATRSGCGSNLFPRWPGGDFFQPAMSDGSMRTGVSTTWAAPEKCKSAGRDGSIPRHSARLWNCVRELESLLWIGRGIASPIGLVWTRGGFAASVGGGLVAPPGGGVGRTAYSCRVARSSTTPQKPTRKNRPCGLGQRNERGRLRNLQNSRSNPSDRRGALQGRWRGSGFSGSGFPRRAWP